MTESKPFWMVWNPLRQPPHHRHETEESAWIEAERLAAKHVDDKFYVLQSLGEVWSVATVHNLKHEAWVSGRVTCNAKDIMAVPSTHLKPDFRA